ncbi:outer membrane beta-barrel protein [Polluticoccus soli]|uniref:outer membrane beta-barrel protein n=1 Tax=Polluticoccus soli TaxID=3034150 RepID=UPI0023E2617F|nr:outer membrane beta-barrel protein [Flavipsychrobacter sp. JY13-12]
MKKLALALLLTVSAQAFAQKNEVAFSVGYINYTAMVTAAPTIDYGSNLGGGGYQFGAYYLRNIKWLQVGGGCEIGWLSSNSFNIVFPAQHPSLQPVTAISKETIAAPFINTTAVANFRLPVKRFTFHAGGAGGYFTAIANRHINFNNEGVDYNHTDVVGGFSGGGQAGITFRLVPGFALVTEASMRYIQLKNAAPTPFTFLSSAPTSYEGLHYYTLSLGARYLF